MKTHTQFEPEGSGISRRSGFIRHGAESGFALVATITMMVLLVLIALAMLSLSTMEIRQSNQSNAHAEAKANARMALMIAIGELQKNAGPDQRVTARADIAANVDPGKKYWTGFWKTDDWDPLDPNTRSFVGWGVSDPEGTLAENNVTQALSGTDLITLVGEGSVEDATAQVKVRGIDLTKDGKPAGGYAWWIGDEGIKASYYVPEVSDSKWNKVATLGTAADSGVSSIDFSGYENLEDTELFASSVSRKSFGVPSSDPNLPRQVFHDVTPQAVALLTDARLGGVRRDLSTAFELPMEDFNELTEFHAAGENNNTNFYDELGSPYIDSRFYHAGSSPDLGYMCEIPYGGGIVRGASWDLVRNYYRLYKKEWEEESWGRSVTGVETDSYAARGSLPHSYSGKKGGANDVGGDTFAYHISNGHLYTKASFGFYGRIHSLNEPRGAISSGDASSQQRTVARSPQVTPIVVRLTVAVGMVKRPLNNGADWSLALSFDPYLTVVNPYNVPVTFNSLGLWCTKFNPMKVTIEYTDDSNTKRTVSAEKYFSGNYYSFGTFNMILDPNEGPYTLEPGETRVISPAKIGDQALSYNYISTMRGGFSYSEDSGFYIAPNTSVKPKDGTTVKVTLDGRSSSWGATDRFVTYLYHDKNHDGSQRNLFAHVPPRNMYGDEDILDQPLISNIGASANNGKTQTNFKVVREVSTGQIPSPGDSGLYVGVLDLRMNTTREDAPSLVLNPRGGAFDTRDWDGLERSSVQWDYSLSQIDDLSQLQLVGDPEGHGFWGEGRTVTDGSTHTVLYEVPQLPLSSLGQLQHVDSGVAGSSGSLEISNSFPHPGLRDLTSIAGRRSTVGGGYSSVTSQTLADLSWASNESLWDRYFFSGINWGYASASRLSASQGYVSQQAAIDALIAGDRSGVWPLQNPRMDLFTRSLSAEQKAELLEYDKLAKYLAVFGGFNVNSTSEKAWQAVFSSLREVDATYVDNTGSHSKQVTNAFSRFMIPSDNSGEVFGSFRELTDSDIENLAEAMVTQVKARGPFMGLADFVNRRLSTDVEEGTDLAAVGALQAAIEAAGLNDGKVDFKPTVTNLENVSYQAGGKSKTISNYAGSSGYLLQADVLSSIGSILSTRSDTFVIRTYGTAKNAKGEVIAKAWCEATVQRTPDWVVPTDEEATRQRPGYPDSTGTPVIRQFEANPTLPEQNRQLGRKFKIQSFRWLSPEEV
ncbi:hypothetical protein [Oceaniferula spumae]